MNDEEVNMAYNQEFFGVLKEMKSLNRKLQADLDKAVEEGFKLALEYIYDLQDQPLKKWSHSRELKFAPVEIGDAVMMRYKKQLNKDKQDGL